MANDAELVKQFNNASKDAMSNGLAPFVRATERQGERVKIELHHKLLISNGGAVYDIENITAITPKQHVKIHGRSEVDEQ